MFQRFDRRGFHYLLLAVVWAVLCLPNLGTPGLWDVDEGNNATCANAMYESGNWVLPTFNNHVRFDKPALLYWLQLAAYDTFGVNEFAARLPSALAALVAIFVTCELGRRTFNSRVGLLAGLVAASAVGFCGAAHFANPDALLTACTALTLLFFFNGYRRGDRWWGLLTGATTALGVLAKGPVGVVLPTAVVVLFLVWERQLRRLWDWRVVGGVVVFLAVAAPWYVWVGLETKGQWLVGFFQKHNVDRFLDTMENHGGPVFYYVLMLNLGFIPWSVFLGPAVWNAYTELRGRPRSPRSDEKRSFLRSAGAALAVYLPSPSDNPAQAATRFLACWVGVFFVFFTLAGTKLPNYILPLYPAVAVLTARLLDRHRTGESRLPAWSLRLSLVFLGVIGIGLAAGLLVVGGVVPLAAVRGRYLPGVAVLAIAGLLPVGGAALAWWYARRDRPAHLLGVLTGTAVLFTATVAAWGPALADRSKAPRELVRLLPADQAARDVRVATYGYFQPSLVFYCRREVETLDAEQEVQDFLDAPLPSYLVLPADRWEELRPKLHGRLHLLGGKYDLYEGREIVVVTNEPAPFVVLSDISSGE